MKFILRTLSLLMTSVPLSIYCQALAHEDHGHFSASEPGNPLKASRTMKVSMLEEGKRMLFDPPVIESDKANKFDLSSLTRDRNITNSSWPHMQRIASMQSS